MGLERFSAFIPYDVFTVETPYSPAEVTERVQSLIAERPVMDLKELVKSANPFRDVKTAPLLGKAAHDSFTVYPKPRGRRSFVPYFYGEVSPTGYGSTVKVRTQLHPSTLIIMGVIAALFTVPLIGSLGSVLAGNGNDFAELLGIVAVFLLAYSAITLRFYVESTPAKQGLLRVLAPPTEKPV